MSYHSKNLSYDPKNPPFLQKLREQYGGAAGHLERPAARPRKSKDNDDEDKPIYFDEETNEVISEEQYNALVHGGSEKEDKGARAAEQDKLVSNVNIDETSANIQFSTPKQNLTEIGGPKKRKQAKVVGEDCGPEGKSREDDAVKSGPKKKSEKKRKKVKLSFGDQ